MEREQPLKLYDIPYSTEIADAPRVWAKPLAGGALDVLFVPNILFGREIVELAQRMDIRHETVTIDRSWDSNKWGLGDFYHRRGGIWDFKLVYQNLENVLTSEAHFDVLVIPGVNGWSYFTEPTRQAIERRVEAGCGLVLIQPFHGGGQPPSPELSRLSPLHSLAEEELGPKGYPVILYDAMKHDRWLPQQHFITRGIPFDCLPFDKLAYYPCEADGDVLIRSESGSPIAATREVGRGRVAAFAYYPRNILPQLADYRVSNCFDSNLDNWKGADHGLTFNHLEYFYSLIGRTIVWAARREPSASIDELRVGADAIEASVSGGEPGDRIRLQVLNRYDETVLACEECIENRIALPGFIREFGGDFRAEAGLVRDGRVADWHAAAFRREQASSLGPIALERDTLRAGDVAAGTVSACPGKAGKALLRIRLTDEFGKVIGVRTQWVEGESAVPFSFRLADIRTLKVRISAEWVADDGYVFDRRLSEPITVTPDDRLLHDFEVFLTPLNRGQGDMTALQARRALDMGVTGLYPGSSKLTTTAGVTGMGVYWYRRKPYTELKDEYLRTRDKSLLRREPCLNDPGFWEETRRAITANVDKTKKYGPVAYFANDEGSITCYADEHDLCHCPHCLTAMRAWLRTEYGDLQRLNRVWGSAFADWDEVAPDTTLEAKARGRFASWSDHRRFMELTFAAAFERIGAAIRAADPAGRVRISGVQATNAFNGYDYYEVLRHVEFIEAYRVGNQYEYHRSFAKPGTSIGSWTGYGAKGNFARHFIWHGLFHGLTLMSLFWECSMLNPDMTFSQSAKDIGGAAREIRRSGIGKSLLYAARRDDLGIAVHFSMVSARAAYIRSDSTRFERNREGWMYALEDAGYQYSFVATQQIEAGELIERGFKVLVLPYSAALGDQEAEQIERFVAGGGTVIGDLQTGIMDEHCQYRERGRLDGSFGLDRYTFEAVPFFGNDKAKRNAAADGLPAEHDRAFASLGADGARLSESGIRAAAGQPLYIDEFMQRIVGVVLHDSRPGKGIYLNTALDDYEAERKRPRGAHIRQLLRLTLDWAGAGKPVSLQGSDGEPIDSGYESFYYTQPGARYAAVLRASDHIVTVGYDGVNINEENPHPLPAEAVRLALDEPAHVYDMRKRVYMGRTAFIETEVSPGEAALFSLLPCAVERISLALPDRVLCGDRLELTAAVHRTPDEAANVLPACVLSVSLYDPSGEYCPYYASNHVAENGVLRLSRSIPYNETTGTWKLVVTDAASGVAAQRSFELLPTAQRD